MIKKTLLLEKKATITCKLNQLKIKTIDREASIPIEDIGFILIEHPETYISIPSLNNLAENNSSVIFCNSKHLPHAMLLNLDSHHIQQEIFRNQISASEPLKKQLWQQTIIQKIKNQGLLLEKQNGIRNQFQYLAKKVTSGDTTNMEAVAANAYWKEIFEMRFKRERFGDNPNNLLNYGYAILRAAMARSLSISGMLNTLGIHHRNKYNSFALADDIMEPFRPLVDEIVIELMQENTDLPILSTDNKKRLLGLLTKTVYFKNESSPLMVALQRTSSSLQQCYTGSRKKINYPELWN